MNFWPFKKRKSRKELEGELSAIWDCWKKALQDCDSKAERLGNVQEELEKYMDDFDALSKEMANRISSWDKIVKERDATIAELKTLPPPKVHVSIVNSTELTLAAWRKEENLLAAAMGVLKNPDVKAMLDVLDNEHPGRHGIALTATIEQRAVYQSRAEGYQLCLNNFYAMAEKPVKKAEIEETWGTERKEKE